MTKFTQTSLPAAIRKLFELNHYEVQGPIQIHGAEIDLLATPLTDPFATPIYIEATIEYVDNDKYGKDVGKLAMIATMIPSARKLIVSSKGFSLPVKERAKATEITTLTYDELFNKFERFEKYVSYFLGDSAAAKELNLLNEIYEEPDFQDALGEEKAIQYLNDWRHSEEKKSGWLIITGDYGTGKTALTKIILRRWLEDYKSDPQLPFPVRIELRDFTKQFDAKGLLHHFLDNNSIGHISIEYLLSLIRDGRAILILDGYDEMAQYLHARERRACLEALAELTAGGARGILTSRPNYFTETEELQVFEILYASLKHGEYYLSKDTKELLKREEGIDKLLEQFIYRYERTLRDLSPTQTESLIKRTLKNDPHGMEVVLNVLRRIYRIEEGRDQVSLAGKPVIVSYLLEIVEGLKATEESKSNKPLTEWQIFKLIIDQLMLRDLKRVPELPPNQRRQFISNVAMFLSRRENATLDEQHFKELISKEFKRELSRLTGESRNQQLEKYFADLRTSATLTRDSSKSKEGWRFSHNTLREYLVSEYLLDGLSKGEIVTESVPISDAMRNFVASLSSDIKQTFVEQLRSIWKSPGTERGRGQLLSLLWYGLIQLIPSGNNQCLLCLSQITGDPPQLNDIQLSRISFSSEKEPSDLKHLNCSQSILSDLSFHSADIQNADFTQATLENIVFVNSNLASAIFRDALIIDADFTGADLNGAVFSQLKPSNISILLEQDGAKSRRRLEAADAIGYLKYSGAITDDVRRINIIKHYPYFLIVDKIIDNLAKSTFRQRRGLEKRGAARKDVSLAERFLTHLIKKKLILEPGRHKIKNELVQVTERGREVFNSYQKAQEVSDEIMSFFDEEGK